MSSWGRSVSHESIERCSAAARLGAMQRAPAAVAMPTSSEEAVPRPTTKLLAQQVKLREARLTKQTRRLTRILNWEPLLGVAVLICVGLMNVFAAKSLCGTAISA